MNSEQCIEELEKLVERENCRVLVVEQKASGKVDVVKTIESLGYDAYKHAFTNKSNLETQISEILPHLVLHNLKDANAAGVLTRIVKDIFISKALKVYARQAPLPSKDFDELDIQNLTRLGHGAVIWNYDFSGYLKRLEKSKFQSLGNIKAMYRNISITFNKVEAKAPWDEAFETSGCQLSTVYGLLNPVNKSEFPILDEFLKRAEHSFYALFGENIHYYTEQDPRDLSTTLDVKCHRVDSLKDDPVIIVESDGYFALSGTVLKWPLGKNPKFNMPDIIHHDIKYGQSSDTVNAGVNHPESQSCPYVRVTDRVPNTLCARSKCTYGAMVYAKELQARMTAAH